MSKPPNPELRPHLDYEVKPGKRPMQPTPEQRRQVMTMAGFGINQEEIAKMVGISADTLQKHFRHELDTGATEANMRVASALYINATKHNQVAAQIWWTKARMGWKETTVNEQAGEDFTFQHLIAARAVLIEINNQRAIEGSVVASETNSHGSNGTGSNGKSNGAAPHDLMQPAEE